MYQYNAYFNSGFDQNEGRRKRQRTASPDPKPTASSNSTIDAWADQLKAAACGPSAISDGIEQSTSPDEQPIGQAQANGTDEYIGGNTRRDLDHIGTLTDHGDRPLDGENGLLRSKSPDRELAATAPKKMLRVRPDGKLGSPKPKSTAADAKPKRNRRSTKAAAGTRTLVVVVHFGTVDASRLTIGGKIDDILSGVARHPSPPKEQPPRPTEPPKPTHPFFIGGSARASRQDNTVSSNEQKHAKAEDQHSQQQKKTSSPRQARVTSKPANIVDRPAGGIALGFDTFGSAHARVSRFAGAMEPMWPPAEMLHVGRPGESPDVPLGQLEVSSPTKTRRKLKGLPIGVPEEKDVLKPYIDLVQAYHSDRRISQKVNSRDWREFRRPLRRLLTGRELQQAVRQRLVLGASLGSSEDQEVDELSSSHPQQQPSHIALRHTYERIATSFTAFDKFECESQDWVHKYAPKATEDVLQQSHEVFLLRDWLRSLTIGSVENQVIDRSRAKDSSVASRRRVVRKKRKRAEGLDDFVVSSDDDASQMDQITDPEDVQTANPFLKQSVIRGGDITRDTIGCERSTNAVVISGPHGCGKTAAVYAVAQELDFEVFEINPGSRRSGRDILDKVGDMTRNHLVKHDQRDDTNVASREEAEHEELLDHNLKDDIASGRQGTMNSFFKSKAPIKKKQQEKKESPGKAKPRSGDPSKCKKQQSHKQSLILLEEVDVLFEEDKMFWATILDLILQSKRPIIMTCTDESLLPLDDMALYAIFRFGPPAEQLVVDYLLLLACNEGHLLSRDALAALYKAKGLDLRASIAELNFFCQMAIGDTKGGLEWMLMTSAKHGRQEQNSEPLRVVSDGTYQHGMGWLGGETSTFQSDQSIALEAELLLEVWNGWDIDIGAFEEYIAIQPPIGTDEVSARLNLEALQRYERAFEALSATDTFAACVSREPNRYRLESTNPKLTEKSRIGFVEGSALVQADPTVDQTGVADLLALTLRACSRRLFNHDHRGHGPYHLDEQLILRMIPEFVQKRQLEIPISKSCILPAFDPIARSQNAVLGTPKAPQISSFEVPMSVIAEDIAPYVRSIVSYDLRLEEQRRQLSSLLSQPGKNGKKTRTTRASRAALEGGSKAHTRRERWFPNKTNFDAVLQSGGKGWQDIVSQCTGLEAPSEDDREDGSRRSSLGSAMETDA